MDKDNIILKWCDQLFSGNKLRSRWSMSRNIRRGSAIVSEENEVL